MDERTSKPKPKRDTRTELRTAQRRYLQTVLNADPERRTLSEIARAGGLNHTTLTRFFNRPDDDRLLETMTVQTIAKVTGVVPPAELMVVASMPAFAEDKALPYEPTPNDPVSRAVQALLRGRNTADAMVLQTRALEDAGYLPGDIVILDQALAERALPNDVVCANIYSRSSLSAETVWRIFQPPYLVAASRDPAHRRPLLVDGEHIKIRGVITDVLRGRRNSM